ncbi:MAG TPA: amino acid transport protein [Planctomycetota bacterium]|nr:amino acid transport protein [Planctomycetota bacterium]
MNFDLSSLIPSLIFGMIGMAYFRYGKKMMQPLHIGVGLGLMILPYFIDSMVPQITVCSLLTLAPLAARWF